MSNKVVGLSKRLHDYVGTRLDSTGVTPERSVSPPKEGRG